MATFHSKETEMSKFFMINDQYNEGIQINEYNGQFSLVTAQMNDGKTYPK